MIIYKGYDKAGLDDQYNNRSKVPNFADIIQGWEQRSERLRQQGEYHANLVYGSHERERLDIFPAAQRPTPVQVFFHGGYWQAFNKDVFHFVVDGFRQHGLTTVCVNYPLGPKATMDEIVNSCRNSLAWLYRHVNDYGGDSRQIYISGHSAGGHLVAMLLATNWPALAEGLPLDLVKGGCAISGLFDLVPIQLSYVNDRLEMDRSMAERNSPIRLNLSNHSPLIVSVGELESAEYHAQSRDFALAWRQAGSPVTELVLPGANHFTVLEQLVDKEARLNQMIVAQMSPEPRQ